MFLCERELYLLNKAMSCWHYIYMPKPTLNMSAYSLWIFDGQNILGLISHRANLAWMVCNWLQQYGKKKKIKQGGKEPTGPLDEFKYKKQKEGTINKYAVICTHCRRIFYFFLFHQSPKSFKYHQHYVLARASSSGARPFVIFPFLRQ